VKSISISNFKPEEVKALQDGGNQVARDYWLARWNSDQFPEPDSGQTDKIRQFMRLKVYTTKISSFFTIHSHIRIGILVCGEKVG